MKLWKQIKKSLLEFPSQKICENDAEMSYEDIAIYSELFASKLAGEECCAILCKSEMAASMALLGCFAANVTAVPLSYRYGLQHCRKIIKKIGPTAIITDLGGELRVMGVDNSTYKSSDCRPAVIMCTSGTTGVPKGVMLSEENLLTNVNDICEYMNVSPEDRILISRPLYHCAVLTGEFLTSIFKGVKIRFYSEEFMPLKLLQLISKYDITVFCGTPTMLGMMSAFRKARNGLPLKSIVVSGEMLSKETGKRIRATFQNADIYHVYGLTEASPRVCFLPPTLFDEYCDCVGVPLFSTTLKITDKSGHAVVDNTIGELWVKGKNVMMGYYDDPELTKKVLRGGWLNTGDMAQFNDNGMVRILGRADSLIIKAGMNIYPSEIENALKSDKRVRDVVVYQLSKGSGEIGIKLSGDFDSVDDVRKLCQKLLPKYQQPSRIEILEHLPTTASGKIIRR